MKSNKFFATLAVVALLLVPATAMAKTKISFSINLNERSPLVMAQRPYIVVAQPPVYYIPCPPPRPRVEPHTIIKEYHYYHQVSPDVEEIVPPRPYHRQRPFCH